MVSSVIFIYAASELEEYTGRLSLTVDGWDKKPRGSLREAASSQSNGKHFIVNSCRRTQWHALSLRKDVDAYRMGLAAAHIAIAANPESVSKSQLKEGGLSHEFFYYLNSRYCARKTKQNQQL